jgi:UDP-N-acetylmuramate--alanine ligase
LNALAAAAIAWQLGVTREHIASALQKFQGIGRRFNIKGELILKHGKALMVDDYGHHPSELAAVFAAARGGWPEKRLVVAFQPHRYSRTRDLFDEFTAVLSTADAVVLTDVYAAGETAILGSDSKSLARSIRARGRLNPVVVGAAQQLRSVLGDVLKDGDLLLIMGAGDIGAVSNDLVKHGLDLESIG